MGLKEFRWTKVIQFVNHMIPCETIDIDFYGHISSKMTDFCSKRISNVTGQVSLMPQAAVLLYALKKKTFVWYSKLVFIPHTKS